MLRIIRKKWEFTVLQSEYTRVLKYSFIMFTRNNDVVNDPLVRKLVAEQTKQWTEMSEKHRHEEWELMKVHLHSQEEILKKLMENLQQNQMKQLDAKHER